MAYHALTITPFVQIWLQNSSAVSVLHVFERACNLVNERREVVSLVATELGAGPFNVVVEANGRFYRMWWQKRPFPFKALVCN